MSVEPVKVAVVFYSFTGNVTKLARHIAAAAEKAGAEVRLVRAAELAPPEAIEANPAAVENAKDIADIPEVTGDDIVWADAVIMGSPTRYGNIAAQLKQFIDSLGPLWFQGKLADKVYSGFAATSGKHGGNESTILALYNSFHHFGGIIVAPGYANEALFANASPYGAAHFGFDSEIDETVLTGAAAQAERVVATASALKAGRAAAAA